ncbi:MAG: hypothetical protein HY074_17270 [Deltaproteobacteria bacterium]|nr:hypothetical protein [Deltaproteobacteria bacterium]
MRIDQLCIRHLDKRAPKNPCPSGRAGDFPGTFFFDTCQRQLWIGWLEVCEHLCATPTTPMRVETYTGEKAYQFLLRVASGLESAIAGETDVFGQLKQAWRDFEAVPAGPISAQLAAELRPWIHRIFEDTKEIRSRHLENLGGASYGTLVRRMLALEGASDRIFIVGAGKIARSVAPFLLQSELLVWNRTPALAQVLAADLRGQGARRVAVLDSEEEGWRVATHVVVCIPLDTSAAGDARRIAWWSSRMDAEKKIILHLGCLRGQSVDGWEKVPEFYGLDSLFELRSSQAEVRDSQLRLARRMCAERSQLRSLGGSITLAHGWEDLGAFV